MISQGGGEFETLHLTKNGEIRNVLVTTRVIELNGKTLLHCIFHDVTEQKKLESNLRASEERFRAISASAMDAIILVDEEDKVIYWNPACEKTFGFKETEVTGKKLSELVIPEKGHKTYSSLLNELKYNSISKRYFELTALKKDRTEFPIDLSVVSAKLNDKSCLLFTIKDISERKQMEASVSQERAMLENITENIGAGLVIVNKDYRILWTNNYLKNLTPDLTNKICYSTFNTLNTICPDCGPKKIFEGSTIRYSRVSKQRVTR